MTTVSPVKPVIPRVHRCDGRVNAWINDQYWVLNCGLSAGHTGNHIGDLGGGLAKTWSDEDGWREER